MTDSCAIPKHSEQMAMLTHSFWALLMKIRTPVPLVIKLNRSENNSPKMCIFLRSCNQSSESFLDNVYSFFENEQAIAFVHFSLQALIF